MQFGMLIFASCFLQSLQRIFDAEMQASFNATIYALLKFSNITLYAILAYILVSKISPSWQSKVFAEIFGHAVVLVLTLFHFRSLLSWDSIDRVLEELVKAVQFLAPLLIHVLSFAVITFADRIMISSFLGAESVGVYTVAYSFGMILGIFHESILKAWNPLFYQLYPDEDARPMLAKLQLTYFFVSLVLFYCFLLTFEIVFDLMVDDKFYSAAALIPIIAFGYTLEGVRKVFGGYLYVHGRTLLLSSFTAIAAVINLVLNFALIPIMGLSGAAWATLISFSLLLVLTICASVSLETSKTS